MEWWAALSAAGGLDLRIIADARGFRGVGCGPRSRRPRYPYHPRRWWCFSRVYSESLGAFVTLFDEEPPGDVGRLRLAECGGGLLGRGKGQGLPRLAARQGVVGERRLATADFDVLVVGGGLAGVAAAKEAAGRGARAALVEERVLGGFLGMVDAPLPEAIEGGEGGSRAFFEAARGDLERLGVKLLEGATYLGMLDEGFLVDTREGLLLVRARVLVVATGGYSPPPLFEGNDLPGVVSAEYGLRLAGAAGIAGGVIRRAAVIGSGEDALLAAGALARAGVRTVLVYWGPLQRGVYAEYAADAGVELLRDYVEKAAGKRRVERLESAGGSTVEVDVVVSALPAYPDVYPSLQAGGSWRFSPTVMAFIPARGPLHEAGERVLVAGLAAGDRGAALAYGSGVLAGVAAAYKLGKAGEEDVKTAAAEYASRYGGADLYSEDKDPPRKVRVERPLALAAPSLQDKAYVDPCNDITVKEVREAYSEESRTLAAVAVRTGLGLGPEQGRVTYQTAAQVISAARGVPVDELGFPEPPHLLVPLEAWRLAAKW